MTALLAEPGNLATAPEDADAVYAVFARHIADAPTASLLIERDGAPIGVLAMHIRKRLNRLRPEAWTPNFIVTERERDAGKYFTMTLDSQPE